jgi:hypothetical protein
MKRQGITIIVHEIGGNRFKMYPYSLGYGDNLNPDEKAQQRYWYQNRYYHYSNPDPSINKYAEISTDEILRLLDDKINKDIYRIYEVRTRSILGQDLAHAVIRLLAWKLLQRVNNIDKFEKQNSADIRNHFDLDSEQEDHK